MSRDDVRVNLASWRDYFGLGRDDHEQDGWRSIEWQITRTASGSGCSAPTG